MNHCIFKIEKNMFDIVRVATMKTEHDDHDHHNHLDDDDLGM